MALKKELEKQGNWLFKHRSFLPLVIIFIGTLIHVQAAIHPDSFLVTNTSANKLLEIAALCTSLLGFLIRVYTVGHTPKNTSGRNTKQGQVAESLNTTGIYSVVRHPLYLGNFLMWLGLAMLTGNFWFTVSFVFLFWLYYERIMYAEEKFLQQRFGKTYADWAEGIPAFLPAIKTFRKPTYPFSWKKVLKKEKNGLFALFLLFCFFDIFGKYLQQDSNYNYYLLGLCLLTGMLYLVVKYLKTHTNRLDEADR